MNFSSSRVWMEMIECGAEAHAAAVWSATWR